MLRIVNTVIALLIIGTLAQAEEIECQNGRCDVIKAVAKAPVVVAEKAIEAVKSIEVRQSVVACKVGFFSKLRKRCR